MAPEVIVFRIAPAVWTISKLKKHQKPGVIP